MKATIKVTMDNPAFTGRPGDELARILRKLADKVDGSFLDTFDDGHIELRDRNGNTVGTLDIHD